MVEDKLGEGNTDETAEILRRLYAATERVARLLPDAAAGSVPHQRLPKAEDLAQVLRRIVAAGERVELAFRAFRRPPPDET
jgi:hypothetical protein